MEEVVSTPAKTWTPAAALGRSSILAKPLSEITVGDEERFVTNISELDRVLGGGIVKGSVVLLSGDPGIGKSQLIQSVKQRVPKNITISGTNSSQAGLTVTTKRDELTGMWTM